MRTVWIPEASASSRMRSSSTVLPTPRSPTIRMLFVGRASFSRSSAIRTVWRRSSRPANSGGECQRPGRKDSRRGPFERRNLCANESNCVHDAMRNKTRSIPESFHGFLERHLIVATQKFVESESLCGLRPRVGPGCLRSLRPASQPSPAPQPHPAKTEEREDADRQPRQDIGEELEQVRDRVLHVREEAAQCVADR